MESGPEKFLRSHSRETAAGRQSAVQSQILLLPLDSSTKRLFRFLLNRATDCVEQPIPDFGYFMRRIAVAGAAVGSPATLSVA